MADIAVDPSEAKAGEKYSFEYHRKVFKTSVLTGLKKGLTDINKVLYILIQTGNLELLKTFIRYEGADLNCTDRTDRRTTLHLAAKRGDVSFIKLLLDIGANVNAKDDGDLTPMDYIFENNDRNKFKELAEVLLSRGADVNAGHRIYSSPFVQSALRGDIESVKLFLRYGAEVNLVINLSLPFQERSVLGAAIESSNPKLLRLILMCGADLNAAIGNHNNILTYLFNERKIDSCEIILQHIAILDLIDNNLIDQNLYDTILEKNTLNCYFERCKKELLKAKSTKLRNCWVTFYNLLMDDEVKLRKYAGCSDLVKDFERTRLDYEFPIYGDAMRNNVAEGIGIRKVWDNAALNLSEKLPIFNYDHLVIKDVLDCFDHSDLLRTCQ